MDSVFALKGRDCVLMVADTAVTRSIVKFTNSNDKIYEIDGNKLMGINAANQADRNQFGDYIACNVHLHRIRSFGRAMSTSAVAHFARTELAEALRQGPIQANLLIAGCERGVPDLFWVDYLGALTPLDKAAHGYGGHFLYGLMDRFWKPDMTETELVKVAEQCCGELETRFLLSQRTFIFKVVDKDGIRVIRRDEFVNPAGAPPVETPVTVAA